MVKKIAVVVYLFLALSALTTFSYCDELSLEQQTRTIRGQISRINWAASTITIRWLQTEGYVGYDEISIFVPDDSSIVKGGTAIGLTRLQIGDQVTAEYINASPGPLKLMNMTVVSS